MGMCAACACLMTGAIAAGAIGITQIASTCLSWIHCSICCTCVCGSKFGSATVTVIPAWVPAALRALAVSCRPGMDRDRTENPRRTGFPAAGDWPVPLGPAVLPGGRAAVLRAVPADGMLSATPVEVLEAAPPELHAARVAAAARTAAAAAARPG